MNRSNGATDLYGAYETVYERPADGYLLGGHRHEAYLHLSLRVRPVATDPKHLRRKDQQDATGWEWTWVHRGTNDPFDRATDTIPEVRLGVPVRSQGIAPTRGDAIREAVRQIESAPDFDAEGIFYRRYLRPILAELDLDERLAHTIKPELVDYVHDPDHAENYALHLDQVVAGLHPGGSRVTTAVIKRVIAAMDRNAVEVHGALFEALGGNDLRARRRDANAHDGWRPGMTLVKGWSVGDDGQPTPPVGVPTSRHEGRVSLPGDDEAWKLWTELRGRYVINQSVGWSLAPHDPQGRPPQRWDPISAAFQNAVHDAKVGSLLFGYTSFRLMHRLPGMEVKLKDGWYSVTAANGHADLTQRHSAEQMISVLSSPAFYGSGDFIVYLLDPSSEITSVLLDKDTTDAKRDEAIFLRLQAVARWLPGVSFWGPTMLATRRAEAAAEAAAQAMKPGNIPGQTEPAPLTPVLLAQIEELTKRARRRYVAAKLHMGGQLPVRRNYVQVVLAVLGMVLPIIIEQLGSSLADFNRAPRIERQRKLIAILSSRLWWLSANPVTVMAARQVAASEKLQNAVLDLLEKHGKEAVAVAGDAAQAALQGEVSRRAATVAGKT
jgi:hypothetical protein